MSNKKKHEKWCFQAKLHASYAANPIEKGGISCSDLYALGRYNCRGYRGE